MSIGALYSPHMIQSSASSSSSEWWQASRLYSLLSSKQRAKNNNDNCSEDECSKSNWKASDREHVFRERILDWKKSVHSWNLISIDWLRRGSKEDVPMISMIKPINTVETPKGRAKLCTFRLASPRGTFKLFDVRSAMVNSWTRATPVEARARDVRTYARNVRSDARWSRAVLPLFSKTTCGLYFWQIKAIPLRWGDTVWSGDEGDSEASDTLTSSCDKGVTVPPSGVTDCIEGGGVKGNGFSSLGWSCSAMFCSVEGGVSDLRGWIDHNLRLFCERLPTVCWRGWCSPVVPAPDMFKNYMAVVVRDWRGKAAIGDRE